MAVATCNSNDFDLAQLHDGILSPVQPCDSSTFPHLLRLPPSFQTSDSPNCFLDDGTASPLLLGSPETAGLSQFDRSLDPPTFVPDVNMADNAMHSETGPVGDVDGRRRASPQSSLTRSRTHATDTQKEQQRERKSRTHSEADKSTSGSHSQTSPSSRKRHHRSGSQTTATGSRSSSAAARHHKASSRPRSKPQLYDAQQQSRPERDLVAFHRESCRLFESFDQSGDGEGVRRPSAADTNFRHRTTRAPEMMSGSTVSPPPGTSPQHQGAPTSTLAGSPNDRKSTDRPPDILKPDSPSLHDGLSEETDHTLEHKPAVPSTVIDWTLPSTRKREYEKIDRSNRGIRGIWRRLAPRWCQGNEQRTPFFEEGKEHEGSVRRFRMDLPDDEDEDEDEDNDNDNNDETKTMTERSGGNKPADTKAGRDWVETKVVRSRDRGGDGRRKSVLWSAAWRRQSGA